MGLTILSVAFPFAPVGPDAVGGAEQVVSALDAGLVAAGHRSLVVAAAGSTVAGTLLPLPAATAPPDGQARTQVHDAVRRIVCRALDEHPVDLVHLHGIDFDTCLPPAGVPALVTLHLPLDWYPAAALRPARPDTHLHGVSASQHRTAPPGVRLLPPVANGVPVERLAIRVAKRRFAVALGRICPEKGFPHALDAARLAGMEGLLAGRIFPYADHERHFREEIQPRLDRRRRFLGPVGFGRKRWLLGAARCLLAPSLVPETSSLVAMEALAAGTPVVAFPAGALAEIVEPGVTGFLVGDAAEMADAIADCARLDPEACRAQALARHRQDAMVARYLDLYEELVRPAARAAAVA